MRKSWGKEFNGWFAHVCPQGNTVRRFNCSQFPAIHKIATDPGKWTRARTCKQMIWDLTRSQKSPRTATRNYGQSPRLVCVWNSRPRPLSQPWPVVGSWLLNMSSYLLIYLSLYSRLLSMVLGCCKACTEHMNMLICTWLQAGEKAEGEEGVPICENALVLSIFMCSGFVISDFLRFSYEWEEQKLWTCWTSQKQRLDWKHAPPPKQNPRGLVWLYGMGIARLPVETRFDLMHASYIMSKETPPLFLPANGTRNPVACTLFAWQVAKMKRTNAKVLMWVVPEQRLPSRATWIQEEEGDGEKKEGNSMDKLSSQFEMRLCPLENNKNTLNHSTVNYCTVIPNAVSSWPTML